MKIIADVFLFFMSVAFEYTTYITEISQLVALTT
jgi:hypothetical protein